LSDEAPLQGWTILLTRSAGRGRGLVDHLSSQGADVVWRPTVAIEALPLVGSTREALQQIERYQWIVFSSPNGVRQFKEALPAVGCEPSQVHGTIAAIGPATAEELRQAGLKPAVVSARRRRESSFRRHYDRSVVASNSCPSTGPSRGPTSRPWRARSGRAATIS
jgi:uroporphyrinogen-III synthase